MSNNPQTAAATKIAQIEYQLQEIRNLSIKATTCQSGINWSTVGDLIYVNEQLSQILDHLATYRNIK